MAVADASSLLGALVRQHRDAILEIAARHRGRRARVFGSVARRGAGEGSDIDFLVNFEDGSSFVDLLHLTDDVRELLAHPVDVVSAGGLKQRDERILAEAVELQAVPTKNGSPSAGE